MQVISFDSRDVVNFWPVRSMIDNPTGISYATVVNRIEDIRFVMRGH